MEDKTMEERIINQKRIQQFSQYLAQEEKSAATVEKYLRDVQAFHRFVEAAGEQGVGDRL